MTLTSTTLGRMAEQKITQKLKKSGYKIIAQNWRTRWCEIDIVAQKDGVVYFVEVKYRLRRSQGEPLEFITTKKLKQMEFAADLWANQNDYSGEMRLVVASVEGEQYEITDLQILD